MMDGIDEILAALWDPLGVGDDPNGVADLYGQAGLVIAEMLERGASASQLAAYLSRAALELAGDVDESSFAKAAEALVALRRRPS